MRITSTTTLAELAVERAVLGIEHLSVSTDRRSTSRIACGIAEEQGLIFGHGADEASAIDEVFQKRRAFMERRLEEGADDAVRKGVPPGV